MKKKNYHLWFKSHLRLAKEILPNLPQTFHNNHELYTLAFDKDPRGHIISYYGIKNTTSLHAEKYELHSEQHENLCEAAERMLKWYRNFVETAND